MGLYLPGNNCRKIYDVEISHDDLTMMSRRPQIREETPIGAGGPKQGQAQAEVIVAKAAGLTRCSEG